jgi:hypothetical protein
MDRRLGTLKIYLNGNPIYKKEHFEEIIPSPRQSENPMIQIWGSSSTKYVTKKIKYFEEPLDFVHVKHHYLTEIEPYFNINDCITPCEDALRSILITSTPTHTPTVTPTPSVTPTITPTTTVTPTVTVTPTTSYCYRYSITNNPTVNLTQFKLDTITMDISKRDFYGRQYDFTRLIQNNVIYFTDLITQANYGTFIVNSGGVVDNGTYWTIGGNFTGDLTANPSVNFNLCFITTTLTPTPSITPTFTMTPTPSITPTITLTPSTTPTKTITPTPSTTPIVNVTNTPTPTVTPTSTPSSGGFGTGPFTFDFDYMVVEYFFTDGIDMDTMTYISNPTIMNNDFGNSLPGDYVGTCAFSANGPQFPNDGLHIPYLIYGGDNTGTGTEAVLFDLIKFKNQNIGVVNLELTFTATWYGIPGNNPVIMRSTMWKGGTPTQDGYTFINPTAVNTKMVQSGGKVITSNTQNCEAFEEVNKFQFNITNYHGQFI